MAADRSVTTVPSEQTRLAAAVRASAWSGACTSIRTPRDGVPNRDARVCLADQRARARGRDEECAVGVLVAGRRVEALVGGRWQGA